MDANRIGTMASAMLLTRMVDKLLNLKSGEVIRAQVVERLPNGNVTLRVNGNLVEARTTVRLPEDATVFFRVLGQKIGDKGCDIQLQLVDLPASSEIAQPLQESGNKELQWLVQEFVAGLPVQDRSPSELGEVIGQVLKALPDDTAGIPKETRLQLQNLMQIVLRSTEESVRTRVDMLLSEPLSGDIPELADLGALKGRLFADMEKTLPIPLKSMLQNSGVALEARLRALAETPVPVGDMPSREQGSAPAVARPSELADLETDFKAKLLQIRQRLLDHEKPGTGNDTSVSSRAGALKEAEETKAALGRLSQVVEGLLRDVETCQLLSRLTNSFYTFLPVIWQGLRDAEIAFKRSRSGPQGKSYYCLMNLDFERFGKLTIVAMMQGKDIFVSFKTDHADFRSVLNNNLPELKNMFQGKGFTLKAVNFLGKQEDHLAPFERLEAFENIINIKI